jgi:hypothetical protein
MIRIPLSPIFLTILTTAACAFAQEGKIKPDQIIHLEAGNKGTLKRTVTTEVLQKLITGAEKTTKTRVDKFQKENPDKGSFVPDRMILTDSCMGSDQYEHDQIAEGSIICLLGITVNATELPFAKVYFEGKDGKSFDLLQLATLPARALKMLKTDGSIGNNLWAALYWIPKVRTLRGQLLVDFKANRMRFRPSIDFPFPSAWGKGLVDKGSKELTVNFGTMKEIIEREYPGMEINPEILETISALKKP